MIYSSENTTAVLDQIAAEFDFKVELRKKRL